MFVNQAEYIIQMEFRENNLKIASRHANAHGVRGEVAIFLIKNFSFNSSLFAVKIALIIQLHLAVDGANNANGFSAKVEKLFCRKLNTLHKSSFKSSEATQF